MPGSITATSESFMTALATDIVRYRPEFARDFARLNRAWLEQYFTIEPRDEEYLGDPEGRILAPGGEIFFAVQDDTVVGTCAAIAQGDGQFELAKLCVTPTAQGGGLGRALARTVVEFARERGARRVVLVSSSRLTTALRLYEALGFEHRPSPGPPPYADADVYMELVFVDPPSQPIA
jgi:GNAT superfamily N-acetyltransferase